MPYHHNDGAPRLRQGCGRSTAAVAAAQIFTIDYDTDVNLSLQAWSGSSLLWLVS